MAIACMESGGTKLVAALADRRGRLHALDRTFRHPQQEAAETLDQLIEMVGKLLAQGETVEAVCLGFGGTVDRTQGRPHICFHERGWEDTPSLEILEDAFQAPVFVENDCKLAALGEAHYGGRPVQGTLFYATLGTGIGGAIVRNGVLLELGDWGEAEIGHIVVDEEGPPCACGNRGCLETLCSGPGLSTLAARAGGPRGDAKAILEAYRREEPRAIAVVELAATYLGRVLGSVINLLQPHVLVLGGGLMQSSPRFLELIAGKTEIYTFPLFRGKTRFAPSRLKERAVCQGCALYAVRQLESPKTRT